MRKQVRNAGFTLTLAAVLMASCGWIDGDNQLTLKGSGDLVEDTYDLAGFEHVNASHTFDVTITPGETFSVVVRSDDNVQNYLAVQVKDKTLWLDLDSKHTYSLTNVTLEAAITMPTLTSIDASGASSVNAKGFASERDFTVKASGASTIDVAVEAGTVQIDASGTSHLTLNGSGAALDIVLSGSSSVEGAFQTGGNVTLEESGTSTIALFGSGGALILDASGSSNANLVEFIVTDATITASGGSEIALYLNGTLNAEASGASMVTYRGEATRGTIEESGGSSVTAAG